MRIEQLHLARNSQSKNMRDIKNTHTYRVPSFPTLLPLATFKHVDYQVFKLQSYKSLFFSYQAKIEVTLFAGVRDCG